MQDRRKKRKSRRRAQRRLENAWAAVEDGRPHIARREVERALDERQDNPAIWNDYGLILELSSELEEAERALRNAILIAPAYAEAYANLAKVVARQGRTIQAERAQRRAVELAPDSAAYRKQLEAYQALLPAVQPPATPESAPVPAARRAAWAVERLKRYDWEQIGAELTDRGCTLLKGLLPADKCVELRDMFDDDERFEKSVQLDGTNGYGGMYRFFRAPLPASVGDLRSGVYARIVPLVNDWLARLNKAERFPPTHAEFLERCAGDGQTRSTAILLRYRAPAANAPHQDVWGRLSFPVQLAVTLSSRTDEAAPCEGGHFVVIDDAGRRAKRIELLTQRGDGVLFCTTARPVRLGGGHGLQSVLHGMTELTVGERYVLGCPFHNYK